MSSNTVSFHNNVTHKRRAKNPSFSSILLDAIYRSIDEDHHHHDHHHHEYPHTTPTSPTRNIKQKSEGEYCNMDIDDQPSKQQLLPRSRTKMRSDCTLETVDLRRAIMIESWMEKQQQRQQQQQQQQQLHKHKHSPSSSSTHSAQQQHKKHHFHLGDVLVRQKSVPNRTRAVVSSSDNSTTRDFSSSSSSSLCFTNLASSRDQSSSRIFTKTKSRALKIYGDLKRSKPPHQNTPISPGRRIAAFLNSIFRNSGNSPARSSPEIKPNTPPILSNSTCSSASSFSRSCLSKTTTTTTTSSSSTATATSKSSSTPGTTTTKRSVRFYPVSVIVDEDSRPCGHKSLPKIENEDSKKREKEIDALMMMMKTNCSSNSKKSNNNNQNKQNHVSNFDEDMLNVDDDEQMQEEEDDDDGESCASSDLFELENLSSIGVSRYYEELPVYGTTSLKNITA